MKSNLDNKEELRKKILEMVRSYADAYHTKDESVEFIPYAGRVYDHEEMENLVDSALEFWLTGGKWLTTFEKGLGKYLSLPYVLAVNSGSSANLVAFMALTSPLLDERRILPGDEVITVAAGFPTTVAPIIQYGAVPVFLDVTLPTYNVDTAQLEEAYSDKTKAVILAHTLGNPFNVEEVRTFCDRHGLWLIEDNCDALGSICTVFGEKQMTGTIGDIATSSFYPPHQMTMGEGGAVYTANPLLYRICQSFRDWGRDCRCPSGSDNVCGHRFDGQYGELPKGYDHKYVYSHFGYNLKITDMQAAIGCAQLKKLPSFVEARRANWKYLRESLDGLETFILPEPTRGTNPSWFGFLMTCKNGVHRDDVINMLEGKGIQTRMLFAGNLVRQPCFDEMRKKKQGFRVLGELKNTDRIMRDSFWIGVYPGMMKKRLKSMIDALRGR
ncbi:lipopolysaccharide biosynthesis protein RfbH [Selenomonas sp. TAMA-11512]|uniref:lipopolysaccharide biosynthesis protein RfbH n=1 Tax=Selenomonas sp. TAMA-11512 TaxID=3095337 RepID=UPI0030855EF2|nr:lipopolysaccharide biosynthesis protein RfbH [Selenomonas sp. TAMA-11512]